MLFLCVAVKAAKSKWKNLRAYFVAEQRKINKPPTGSHGSVKVISSWAHFNQLMFLRDTLGTYDETRDDSLGTQDTDCSQQISMQTLIAEESVDEPEGTSPPTAEQPQTNTTPQPTTAQGNENGPQYKEYTPSSSNNFSLHRSNTNKRKLGKTGLEERYTAAKRAAECLAVEKRKVGLLEKEINADNDPDLQFFKSLLPYMADFNPTQKLRIRSKIQDIILTEYERREATARYSRASSETYTSLDSSSYNPSPVTQLTYTEINSISPVEGEVNWEMGPTYNQQPQN